MGSFASNHFAGKVSYSLLKVYDCYWPEAVPVYLLCVLTNQSYLRKLTSKSEFNGKFPKDD